MGRIIVSFPVASKATAVPRTRKTIISLFVKKMLAKLRIAIVVFFLQGISMTGACASEKYEHNTLKESREYLTLVRISLDYVS